MLFRSEGTPAPKRLTACQGPGGAPAVFPAGPEVCLRLGLEPYRG